jgi:hypothetical protein
VINLTGVLVGEAPDTEDRKNAMEISVLEPEKRKYLICCNNETERKIWITEINKIIASIGLTSKKRESVVPNLHRSIIADFAEGVVSRFSSAPH